MELLPAEQIQFNRFLDSIRSTFEEFGFVPQDTPLVENADILFAKIGEDTQKEIYRFTKGDDDLGLRFDLTVPLARYVAMRGQQLAFPYRRYQIGKVYRGERQQKGRFREFYQCDIDIVGSGELSLINDAEIPAVIYRVFTKLNIGEFVIRVNNRKILTGLVEGLGFGDKIDNILRIVDKIEKVGEMVVKEELLKLGISEKAVIRVIEFMKITGSNEEILNGLGELNINNEVFRQGLSELKEVMRLVSFFGVPESSCVIDLTIARGLSYYTGTVYETTLKDERVKGSVCSGGRYDNLAESYSEQSYPGVGMSIGLTRLFSQLLEVGILKTEGSTISKVLVIPMDEEISYAMEVATNFRTAGINTELYSEPDKFKKKLNYANKIGVPFVAIIGEDEINKRVVAFKNMMTGEQKQLSVDECMALMKE